MANYLDYINSNNILYPNYRQLSSSFVPSYWVKGVYVTKYLGWMEINLLEQWIYTNLTGGWSYYIEHKTGESKLFLAFENPHDKFMFELGGGVEILKVK